MRWGSRGRADGVQIAYSSNVNCQEVHPMTGQSVYPFCLCNSLSFPRFDSTKHSDTLNNQFLNAII